jgi:O-succinylbenzoic acid--CoA ligase
MRQIEIIELKELLCDPSRNEIVVYTTGSTGNEKAITLTKENLLASARASNKYLGTKPGETWSLLLPTNHIAGINVLVRSVELGTDPVGIQDKADYTAIVPTQLFKALNGDSQLLAHLQNCKVVLVGGAATPENLIAEAKAAGIKIITTYGSTETCGGCIYDGRPLEGIETRINKDGLLEVKGPMVFISDWYTTSDLAEIVDGQIKILGRNDDLIISGGENISINQIERLLQEKFTGDNFVAVGVPDSKWGTKLCLLSDGDISFNSISDLLRAEIGNHAVPKEYVSQNTIPLIGIGKVDRVAVQQLFTSK